MHGHAGSTRGLRVLWFLVSFLLFLLVLLLVSVGLFYFKAANQLNRLASTVPVALPPEHNQPTGL